MATYINTWRNKVWIVWFVVQVPLIVFMDLLEFLWPAWVYEPAGAPLHAVFAVKQEYIQKYNDPIVQWTPETASGHDSWMGLFLYLEFAFLLPTALYGIYRLGVQRRGTSGRDELLFLVYGLELSFTTLVCIYDSLYWDSAACSAELKRELQVQLYGPWLVIPAIGAVDMATRILGRIKAADAASGAKKSQ